MVHVFNYVSVVRTPIPLGERELYAIAETALLIFLGGEKKRNLPPSSFMDGCVEDTGKYGVIGSIGGLIMKANVSTERGRGEVTFIFSPRYVGSLTEDLPN